MAYDLFKPANSDSVTFSNNLILNVLAEGTALFDLSTLGLAEGSYTITVRAKAPNYLDSIDSNAVTYVVYPEGDLLLAAGGEILQDSLDNNIEITEETNG